MNKRENIVFKIEELPFGMWLSWLVLIAWIFFALYKFPVNPVFFTISIVTAVILIYIKDERILIVGEETLEIKVKKIFPVFNRSKIIYYSDIKEIIIFDRTSDDTFNLKIGSILLLGRLLPVRTSIEEKITIEYKNGNWETFKRIGSLEDNIRLDNYMKTKI